MSDETLARRARAAVGMTQRAFAELIGATQVTVARWETGAVEPRGISQAVLKLVLGNPERSVEVLGADRPSPRTQRRSR